jgi:hypothetical protein
MRDWCAATGYSLPDLIGRGRAVREAGFLTQGGHGVNAPAATSKDGAALLLSIVAARLWKEGAKGVEKYGHLPLCGITIHDEITRIDSNADPKVFPLGTPFFSVLTNALEQCGSKRAKRLSMLKVDRSEVNPSAILTVDIYDGETHKKTYFFVFMRPSEQNEVYEESARLNHIALNTMADLLAPNVEAANRARSSAGKKETGPSVLPDEPVPSDDLPQAAKPATNPSDNLPRAARPATSNTNLEASGREKESQAGFQSYGRSSGGAFPLQKEENPHDSDRSGPAQPCAA